MAFVKERREAEERGEKGVCMEEQKDGQQNEKMRKKINICVVVKQYGVTPEIKETRHIGVHKNVKFPAVKVRLLLFFYLFICISKTSTFNPDNAHKRRDKTLKRGY